jgi:hypothetical protein
LTRKKLLTLLKLGFFPVHEDFWTAAGLPFAYGEGFDWAMRMPLNEQGFMPFRGRTLQNKSAKQLKEMAARTLTMRR